MSFCNTSVAYCCLDRVYCEKFDDTKGVTRSRKSKDRQNNGQNKGVTRSRKSKDRQYNGQNKRKETQKDKQWSTKHYKENYKYTWLSIQMTES